MWVFYLISLPLTLGMVILTLKYFAGPDVPRYVFFTVGYTWFCSISIIILVPADIWTVLISFKLIFNFFVEYLLIINILGLSSLHSSLKITRWLKHISFGMKGMCLCSIIHFLWKGKQISFFSAKIFYLGLHSCYNKFSSMFCLVGRKSWV